MNYKVIHFATHGMVVPEVPELSALVLSQNKTDSTEDNYLRADEISQLKLNADFVALSACETGLGKNYKGDGVVGLTQSFMIAGANSLAVSLWQVADESTSIFMTAHGDVALAVEAMRHGAFDFIEKPFQSKRLLAAIAAAYRPVPDSQTEAEVAAEAAASISMNAKPDPDVIALLHALSLRERQVLDLVLFGERNKVIADKIGISIKTVEMHRGRLMAKMKAHSLVELVRKTLGYTPTTHVSSVAPMGEESVVN